MSLLTLYRSAAVANILDSFTGAAAAYSLRALTDGNPTVVRVRRSSDDAEANFTAQDVASGALLTWVGTTASDDGHVVTWFDQSGNGNDATQATAANQPLIVNAGNLVVENGRAAIDFDGSNDVLAGGTSEILNTSNPFAVFTILKESTTRTNNGFFSISSNQTNSFGAFINEFIDYQPFTFVATNATNKFKGNSSGRTQNQQLFGVLFDGVDYTSASSYAFSVDGKNLGSVDVTSLVVAPNTNQLRIGMANANYPGVNWLGKYQELIIYASDQSANRVAIEANIADYYGINIPGSLGQFTWDSNTSSPAASQTSTRTVTNTHLGMKRCIVNDAGVVQYYLNPFDSTEKEDGTAANLDGTDGQVMVEIPKFYTRRTVSGTETTWSISDRPRIGFTVHPAFVKDGVEVDYRYYGAYLASVYAPATGSITATTEDDPVKITSTGHGLETNCQVTITGTGITELDDESFVVTKVDNDNFTLNGLDGTGIGTAATGTWEQEYLAGLNLEDSSGILSTGTTNELASVSGVYPIVGLTRDEARTLAANRGSVWRQLDYTLWSAVQMLYLVEYQTFYSQDELGDGNTGDSYVSSSSTQADSPHSIAGTSNSLGNASTDTTSGADTVTDPPTAFMSYRGIENWYGNALEWVDGININVGANGNAHVTNNRADFADNTSSNMTLITSSWPTTTDFIVSLQDVDNYFAPLSVTGGSSSTYITDRSNGSSTSNRTVFVGGAASSGTWAGAFRVVLSGSINALLGLGARLAC